VKVVVWFERILERKRAAAKKAREREVGDL
jgi:hypothetical protein